ncbi:HD domain-containing protein [Candidatus Peregrinibacteria bacterium]|nr:HD domain-containing protein [Candidatus Peregrinibacteria bacterium]
MITKAVKILDILEKKYKLNLDGLIESIKSYNKDFNEHRFREAFAFAALAHDGQTRKQDNIPYIIHPFETAKILTQLHADETTLIASLLHDVPEDTEFTLEQIEHKFGKQVSYMVEGITKLSKVHYRHDMQQREIESMKKLFIHVAEDPRTMLIKLADRLHNMRTLEYMDNPDKRLRKARETLEIFTPIANLLGIKELQAELEDLCFINLFPEDYTRVKEAVQKQRKIHAKDLEKMILQTEAALSAEKIDAIVYAYQENLYQTYSRLKRENRTIEDLEITYQINVIVHDLTSCYEALGIIHGIYRPNPGKFKDYISLPKANGYQSIHSTVFGVKGIRAKYRIRTNQMHFEAQYGIAASYFSEDGKKKKWFSADDPRSQWVEEALAIQKEPNVEAKYFDELKNTVFQDRITVLTPEGEAIDLQDQSTCIDFAYAIHTEVGNRSIRAIVNGNNVPLDYRLKKGDVVKIVTTDYSKGPSYEWLSFAKTPLALKKIKESFKRESQPSKIQLGRKILQKEYDRGGYGIVSNLSKWRIQKVANQYSGLNIRNTEGILIHLAEGSISPLDLMNTLYHAETPKSVSVEKISHQSQKLIKFNIRLICKPKTNLIKMAEVIQKHKDQVFLVSSLAKYHFFSKKLSINSSMMAASYSDISMICSELEKIDGVEEVTRQFLGKKILFLFGSILTFLIWAMHPLVLNNINSVWEIAPDQKPVLTNIVLFSGLFVLFGMIMLLKLYTENSFPELRDKHRLSQITYILNIFALITVFLEIYLLRLNVDLVLGLGTVTLIFAYLTGRFIFQKEKNI